MKKIKGPQALKGRAIRPYFETYTKYFGVDDEDQNKYSSLF